MPTVADVLRQSGFSEAEIAKLDQRATTAFGNILTEAERERQQAELERKSNVTFYEERIMPALVESGDERLALEAAKTKAEREAAFYRSAAEAAGILSAGEQPRDEHGRFVANVPGSTAGSPTFLDPAEIVKRAGQGLATIADVDWKYRCLYGSPLPVSPSQLIQEADQLGIDPMAFANRKFKFVEKEQELAAKRQAEHDEAIRRAAIQENDRKWAERTGNHPELRVAHASRMSEIAKASRAGEIPNPLKMSDQARREATRQQIHADIAAREDRDA